MKNVRMLPIKQVGDHFLLRVEAEKEDGTEIFAEGLLQRPGLMIDGKSTLPVPLTEFNLGTQDSDVHLRRTIENLLMTLKTVAAE